MRLLARRDRRRNTGGREVRMSAQRIPTFLRATTHRYPPLAQRTDGDTNSSCYNGAPSILLNIAFPGVTSIASTVLCLRDLYDRTRRMRIHLEV